MIAAAQLAPLLLLLPAASGLDWRREAAVPAAPRLVSQPRSPAVDQASRKRIEQVAGSLREETARQVRIERRMSIRIIARPTMMPSDLLFADPGRISVPRLRERKMGKCISTSAIAGMTPHAGNRLIFYLRDQRVVSAMLERACFARDFYSGFYLARSEDGKLCVDRDTLLSRSGANCKLKQIRELVQAGD